MDQPVDHCMDQPVDQSVDHSVARSVDHSVEHSVDHPTSGSFSFMHQDWSRTSTPKHSQMLQQCLEVQRTITGRKSVDYIRLFDAKAVTTITT